MEFIKKIPKRVLILLAVILALIIAAIIFFSLTRPYSVLFTGLNNEEATSVVTFLQDQGVTDYRLQNNDTVLVPASRETELKAMLLMQGYPKSGYSYESYFNNTGSLSTESERDRAFLIALQDKMAGVIRSFDGVKDAQVIITLGEDRTYVLDSGNKTEASASVLVTMKDQQMLTDKQVEAIRSFVAHGVEGLKIGSVSISDNLGNLYSGGLDGMGATDASALKLMLEERYNNNIRTSVMRVLAPAYGEDNIKVGVFCTVDVSKVTQDNTDVFLPDWANEAGSGEGIIGSKIYDDYIIRGDNTVAGGVVGTTTNSDLPTYIETQLNPDGTERTIRTSGQVDYDNSRQETHRERMAGYLTDCMVAVTLNSNVTGNINTGNLQLHIARAAGITDDQAAGKISIYPVPFPGQDDPLAGVVTATGVPLWVILAAAGGLLLFILLLLLILMIRRKKRKKKEEEELLAAAMSPSEMAILGIVDQDGEGADVMSLKSEKSMELRKKIREFAEQNPEIAAQMLRNLMRGGEVDG